MNSDEGFNPTLLQAAYEQLRNQHEALQRDYDQLVQANKRSQQFERLADGALDGIIISDPTGVAQYVNAMGRQLLGVQTLEECAARMAELLGPELVTEQIAALQTTGRWQGSYWANRVDGSRWRVLSSVFPLTDDDGQLLGFAAFARDITEEYTREQQHFELQAQVIATQQAVLHELSSPLLPIAEGVVVLPLIGTIDSHRAQHIMEALLSGIAVYQASHAIVDITGVKVIDTQVAQVLVRMAQAATLLGTQVILTGIAPEIAQTLVTLGVDLRNVLTRSNLQSGVAFVLAQPTR